MWIVEHVNIDNTMANGNSIGLYMYLSVDGNEQIAF